MPLFNIQTIFMILFFLSMLIFLYKKRKNIEVQKILYPIIYFVLYRTKVGILFMDYFAKKYKRVLKYVGYFGIFIGFLGMILITVLVANNFIKMLTRPEALPNVALVLPIPIKGVIFVPFFYWIISIFIIAIVHEFSHGIIARLYNIRIKSSGFAFLGILIPIIPAAFVEPDEKELVKRPKKEQLSVFAAGPLSNIILGYIFLVLLVGISPISEKIIDYDGLEISSFPETDLFPAEEAGMKEGEIIMEIDNIETFLVFNFTQVLQKKKPGDIIKVSTDRNEYEITLTENPENKSRGYLGVLVTQHQKTNENVIERYGNFLPSFFLWLQGLLIWLTILNIGIGLFNLIPVGPLDGGRMFHLILINIFKKKTGEKIWKLISILLVVMLLSIILQGFFR